MPNPKNERIKREYAIYLKEAESYQEQTVDAALAAIHRFEVHTRFRDFATFRQEQAVAFKRHLGEQTNARTGKPLSKSTLLSTLVALKAFFHWLAGQRGYKSRLQYSDSDYFNMPERDSRIARSRPDKAVPSLDQVRHVILSMKAGTAIERRDRALVAFILLTAVRDGAVIGLKLKHVDLERRHVLQDPREVATKFGKTIDTYFFPVGDDVRRIVEDWIAFLETELHWGPDDPLFPATRLDVGPDRLIHPVGLDRKAWLTADPVRKVFREAFTAAGLPYFSPHRIRDTISALGQSVCPNAEALKAWSQNMGHERVMTTLTSYGPVPGQRQAELMRGLGTSEKRSRAELASQMAALTAEMLNAD